MLPPITSAYPTPRPQFGRNARRDFWKRAEEKGWKKPPLHKRAWNHRWRVLLPLLGAGFATGAALPVIGTPADTFTLKDTDGSTIASCEAQGTDRMVCDIPGRSPVVIRERDRVQWMQRRIDAQAESVTADNRMDYVKVLGGAWMTITALEMLYLAQTRRRAGNTPFETSSAYHELGHLLTAIGDRHSLPVVGIEVKPYGTGHSRWDRSEGETRISSGKALHKMSRQERYQYEETMHRVFNGGFAMERLMDGFEWEYGKRFRGDNKLKAKAALQCLVKGFPSNTGDTVKLLLTSQQQAMEVLIKFDRKVVDELAERLANDGQWDEAKIQQLIKEYGLDQV